jgi:hypothetical protein
MKSLPLVPELTDIAPRVVWFEEPAVSLSNSTRFLAYLMTFGTVDDIAVVRKHVSNEEFTKALDTAPPGIIDARSWAYWNILAGRYPTPPMPQRVFG